VLAVLAWMFLVQSPTFLAAKGEHAQAREVLVTMARQNGAPTVPGTFRQEAATLDADGSSDAKYQALFGRRMLSRVPLGVRGILRTADCAKFALCNRRPCLARSAQIVECGLWTIVIHDHHIRRPYTMTTHDDRI